MFDALTSGSGAEKPKAMSYNIDYSWLLNYDGSHTPTNALSQNEMMFYSPVKGMASMRGGFGPDGKTDKIPGLEAGALPGRRYATVEDLERLGEIQRLSQTVSVDYLLMHNVEVTSTTIATEYHGEMGYLSSFYNRVSVVVSDATSMYDSEQPVYSNYSSGYVEGMILGLCEACWNSPIARFYVPDVVSIGFGGDFITLLGAGTSFDLNIVMRGDEAFSSPSISVTQSIAVGASLDVFVRLQTSNYLGSVDNVSMNMIETNSFDPVDPASPTIGFNLSESALISLGGGASATYYNGTFVVDRGFTIGLGLPAPNHGCVGVSNTWILYKFGKR